MTGELGFLKGRLGFLEMSAWVSGNVSLGFWKGRPRFPERSADKINGGDAIFERRLLHSSEKYGIIPEKIRQRKRMGKDAKANFDWEMHYFRAFAILAIMACHYAAIYGYGKLDKAVFTSSTVFFLFISGYLCQFLHDKHSESPLVYYRKKLVNVICPFLLFSLLIGIGSGMFAWHWKFLTNVLLGRVQLHYWYIPFVSLLFIVSPGLCRLGDSALAMCMGCAGVLFLLFPYRIEEFTLVWPEVFYQYTYFTFFYVFGFWYCRRKAQMEATIKRYFWAFATMAIFLLVLLWNGEVAGLGYASRGIAVNLQRFLTIFCVLGILQHLRDKRIWLLDNIAKFSFTLYFIHLGLFIKFGPIRSAMLKAMPVPVALLDVFAYAGLVLAMMGLAMGLKRIIGEYSRPVIGA